MSVIVRCRTCGQEFEVDRGAVLDGSWRRRCPRCWLPDAPGERSSPSTAPSDRQGAS
jgi:hypothetical protein